MTEDQQSAISIAVSQAGEVSAIIACAIRPIETLAEGQALSGAISLLDHVIADLRKLIE